MTQKTTPATRLFRRASATRRSLMMSCASVALAAAVLQPQSARAQAFQGNITTFTGSVSRVTPTANTETITIGSNTATINWTPTEVCCGRIDFLPNGNTATFTSAPGITDYTVLNRIVPVLDPNRGISLNGHIISTLQGTSATGGRIWFYSPGGILIGSTAVIDVGSLLLTTNDVTSWGTTAGGFNATFSAPSGSTANIQVQNGAQINALQQNSYIALVAPRVEQGGKVRVNGSAAYVAGEQLTMTMNQGLFDIAVDVGTNDSNGIIHTGETSGPANSANGDNHTIYMVAVPKNQAITMLLSGGKVGFDEAVSAQVQNGQILLSSGVDHVSGTTFVNGNPGSGGLPFDMTISGGSFTSPVRAVAAGNIEADGGEGTLSFAGDVSLFGVESARLTAHDGDTVTIGGNLTLSSDDLRYFIGSGEDQVDSQGGLAALLAESGGSITVAGSATISANSSPTVNVATNYGGRSHGGTATLDANGGNITIGGATLVSATAFGDNVSHAGIDGRTSTGGDANVYASSGGMLHLGGPLDVIADGQGSISALVSGGTGGTGEGGSTTISTDSGGAITIAGTTSMSAAGIGGGLLSSTNGTGGEGDAGDSSVFIDGGSIAAAGDLFVRANGSGGNGLTGGDGFGGSSIVEFFGGGFSVGGELRLAAAGIGGDGLANALGTGGQGGEGVGGFAAIGTTIFPEETSGAAPKDAPITNIALGSLTLNADGTGGVGGSGATGGAGGSGEGGEASITLSGTTTTAGDIFAHARGFGGAGGAGSNGAGGAGGDGSGGLVDLFVDSDSNLTGATYHGAANAWGGDGGAGSSGRGDGGSAESGSDDAFIDGNATFGGSSNNFDGVVLTAYAQGGAGANGGSASAGESSIGVNGSLTVAGLVQAAAQAAGGNGDASGGSADAGSASINAYGNLTTNTMFVGTNAVGGNGNTGGDALGGFGSIFVNGTLNAASIDVESNGTGGAGVAQGGEARGGFTDFDAFGGSAHVSSDVLVHLDAFGGSASNGAGGSAIGGSGTIESLDGGSFDVGNLTVTANANGGNGTTAGLAGGGQIQLFSDSFGQDGATSFALDHVTLTANGTLGTGASDGSEILGYGGSIDVFAHGGSITAESLSAQSNGSNFGGSVALGSDVEFGGVKGQLSLGTTNVTANGNDLGGFIFVNSGSGSIVDLGNATLTANGAAGGQIFLGAGNGCDCGDGEAPRQSAALPTGGGIAASNLTLTTSGSIFMDLSAGADISVAGTLRATAGGLISLNDDGSGGAIRAHIIDLTGLSILDNADIIADIIRFTSLTGMTVGNLTASDAITLTAGGDLETGDLTATNALTLDSKGDVDAGNLTANNVTVKAGADFNVHNVTAGGSATFTAGGLASFDGIVRSPTITVTSGDIDVLEGASLGVFGVTNLITLNAVSHGLPIILGDNGSSEGGASGQYHFGSEDGDVRSAAVVINAVGAGEGLNPDVQVFDAHIEGSATSGGGVGALTVNTPGSVFVLGNVRFTDAGATDSLTVNAGHNIEVNTDTGSIVITDSTGQLAGTLRLHADNVWVGSGSILHQLETDVNFAGRDTALGTNAGTTNPNGFVRAGTITGEVSDSFLVENSGTPDLFAGIDTGAGGLSITSTGATPATLIIYGRQTNANGTTITNQDFLGSVALSGTGGFTNDSSVNGCTIGSTCGEPPVTPGIDMASILGPLDETNSPDDEDKKKDKDKGDESDDGSSVDPSLRLINTTPINLDHQIDEPVTSSGDVVIGGGPVSPY